MIRKTINCILYQHKIDQKLYAYSVLKKNKFRIENRFASFDARFDLNQKRIMFIGCGY
jgi:hypothetical protein